jgi:hypothetical protein
VYTLAGQDAAARASLQRLERALSAAESAESAAKAKEDEEEEGESKEEEKAPAVEVVAAMETGGEQEEEEFPPRGLLGPRAELLGAWAVLGGCGVGVGGWVREEWEVAWFDGVVVAVVDGGLATHP